MYLGALWFGKGGKKNGNVCNCTLLVEDFGARGYGAIVIVGGVMKGSA
jgi:hypothetical protein